MRQQWSYYSLAVSHRYSGTQMRKLNGRHLWILTHWILKKRSKLCKQSFQRHLWKCIVLIPFTLRWVLKHLFDSKSTVTLVQLIAWHVTNPIHWRIIASPYLKALKSTPYIITGPCTCINTGGRIISTCAVVCGLCPVVVRTKQLCRSQWPAPGCC